VAQVSHAWRAAVQELCTCKGLLQPQGKKRHYPLHNSRAVGMTKPWSNAKVVDGICLLTPKCFHVANLFGILFFQILFDQAQRSVRQQLHNFVKE